MDFLRAIQAFTSHMDVPDSAVAYYTIVRRNLDLIKSGCYIAVTVVSDALIGYRTFVVWGQNYLVALVPVTLVLADVGKYRVPYAEGFFPNIPSPALGVYAVWLLSQVQPGNNALMAVVTERVKYFYTITLILNLLCTLLISYKIWQVQAEVDRYSPSAVRPRGTQLILIVVESDAHQDPLTAAIYSAMLIVLITSSSLSAVMMLAVLNVIAPVIGIVFSMVIIRFSIDRTRWDSLKISTHLNFASSTIHDDDKNEPDSPVDMPSPITPAEIGSRALGKEKITVESHVRPASQVGLGLGIERYTDTISLRSLGSVFSHSKTSLPEFCV
ncbi:uncharacterized protein PHACADRAFT_26692 [Phanerochaete carnosa HHB-10118-sp]|uniref:Uncharacterized protein n=1 Tax=Phanerochaete carnosa (strain HHB-10118-sp) TaxID=650164 RepID=K5X5N2_PHACS|nr:uncharacterized protein PHACADRAFT_26692 [Phanerochaete carnosa HHB-10118-sp]EKM58167.1 hypothetical protein PHACADRAFT_26692 [Phanerochaete carnosa HHB-10118-sp]